MIFTVVSPHGKVPLCRALKAKFGVENAFLGAGFGKLLHFDGRLFVAVRVLFLLVGALGIFII